MLHPLKRSKSTLVALAAASFLLYGHLAFSDEEIKPGTQVIDPCSETLSDRPIIRLVSGTESILFYRGPLPSAALRSTPEARVDRQFFYNERTGVVAVVSRLGIFHQTLAAKYVLEGSEVMGGTRYGHNGNPGVINSTHFPNFDGIRVQDENFIVISK